MSIFRAYLINAETGEEMTDHPLNGKTWLGTSGNVYRDGKFVRGTASRVTVADYADLRTTKNEAAITPDQFDHPVVVKVWGPDHQDWRYLIDDSAVLTDLDKARAARCEARSFTT
jgi:hypothetical protein